MRANIKIGGNISRPVLNYLAEQFDVPRLLSEEARAEATSPEVTPYLEMENNEALWGRFEELETYLMRQGLPFDRLSDGRYEYSPELRKFCPCVMDDHGAVVRPEADRTFLCDHDSRPMAALTDVRQALAEMETRAGLAARLASLCGPGIPDLPPLHIVAARG